MVELQRPEIVAQVTDPAVAGRMPMNKSVPKLRKVTPILAKLLAIGLATNQTHIFNMALSEPAIDHLHAGRFPPLPSVDP